MKCYDHLIQLFFGGSVKNQVIFDLVNQGGLCQYLIIMQQNRFRLIHNPATIIIDRQQPQDSDIDEDSFPTSTQYSFLYQKNHQRNCHSLLNSVNLKGRREPVMEIITKQQPIVIEESSESELLLNNPDIQPDSQSLVFIKKKTTPECLKKKLRRLATVPNIVKLERRDENKKQCSICLTDLKDLQEKQIGRLNCKHIFCFNCILQASKYSNRCPYCRASFSMIRHGKLITHVQEARLNEGFDNPYDEPCYICGRNDDFERLLQCQYCQYSYCHTYCDTRLNSDQPPAGHWYCLGCEELLRNQLQVLADQDQIFQDES